MPAWRQAFLLDVDMTGLSSRTPVPESVPALGCAGLDAAGVPYAVSEPSIRLGRVAGVRLVVRAEERTRAHAALVSRGAREILVPPDLLASTATHLLLPDETSGHLFHVEVAELPAVRGGREMPGSARLCRGGAMVAVVGGDGAGKSTVVAALVAWLGEALDVAPVHLGKPRRTAVGLLVKGSVALGRRLRLLPSDRWGHYPTEEQHRGVFPGYAWLLWQVTTAHDRRRLYRRAESYVNDGALVVADRFPLAQLTLMDGSRTRWLSGLELGRLAARLVRYEQQCYQGIRRPDVVLVLRVDPEIAVARKTGVDPADFVRPRSAEVFDADWSGSGIRVVDASRDRDEVLRSVRAEVWKGLL